jgi:Family of unknown function (DUF5956)
VSAPRVRPTWGPDEDPLRDDWPAAPLPPEHLPAVLAARADGWFLAPDAPLWSFLPAVWPTAARAWVPDRSVRLVHMSRDGPDGRDDVVVPWSAWDHAEVERDVDALLRSAGVPARPFGRLWLLRPPPHVEDLDDAVDSLAAGAGAAGVPLMCCAALVDCVAAQVREWFPPAG